MRQHGKLEFLYIIGSVWLNASGCLYLEYSGSEFIKNRADDRYSAIHPMLFKMVADAPTISMNCNGFETFTTTKAKRREDE
jgi:hypothetical protein